MAVPGGRKGWKWFVVLGLGLAVGLGLGIAPGVGADDPKPQATPAKAKVRANAKAKSAAGNASKANDGGAFARQTFSALAEIHASVRKENAAGSSGIKLPERHKKTITRPTLTPAELDSLVDQFLVESKTPAASPTHDVEFVRRIYLDVTGKLPTPEQTIVFLSTREKDKRGKLIEYLLASPEYAANMARFWRDVVQYHATNQNFQRFDQGRFEDWLKEQFAKNRPWDEVAHDMIAAKGRIDENGAAAFPLAHDAQAVELAGEVSRVFLGVQIQCAQCHDHPSDKWKREQFHEFAAFFAGGRTKRANKAEPGVPPVFEVVLQGKPRYTMPDKKDPQKQIPIAPKFFLASDAKPLPNGLTAVERHEVAADYITDQNNPWFAKAFVNRVWGALMGDSFYNPVDDMGPEREAKAPEVIETLASQWAKGGYDVRWLYRTILNTKAYQREVRSTYSASSKTPFAANCASRLRADQILDSLAQALNLPMDGQGPRGAPGAMLKKGALSKDLAKTVGKLKGAGMRPGGGQRFQFNALYGVDPSVPSDEILGTIPQALFLMNSTQINRALEARPGAVLGEILGTHPNNLQALNALYLRVFAREPTPQEVKTCGRYLEAVGNRKEAFEDIFWSLINSTEFITRR